jgi:glycosyltransferase involved in cell wall biosynthesis
MRILIPLDNRGGGGIARVAAGLTQALPDELRPGDELLIQGAASAAAVDRPNVRVMPGPRLSGNAGRRAVQQQVSLLRSARLADLVHMTDHRPPLLGTAPFVITVHDVSFLDHPEWFPRGVVAYKRLMLVAALAKRPRGIVCVSEFTRRRLLTHRPGLDRRCEIRVIPPGLEPPAPGRSSPDATGPEGEEYFLTVSGIEPRKNHLGLLAAFQEARRRGLKLRWKVVGAPQYHATGILEQLRSADGVDVVGRASESALEAL